MTISHSEKGRKGHLVIWGPKGILNPEKELVKTKSGRRCPPSNADTRELLVTCPDLPPFGMGNWVDSMERDGLVPWGRYMSLLSMSKHHHLLHHRVFFELNMFLIFPLGGQSKMVVVPFANHSKQRGVPTPKKDKTHAQIYGSFSNQGRLACFILLLLLLLFSFSFFGEKVNIEPGDATASTCRRGKNNIRRSDSEDMKYISKLRALISEEELRRDFPPGPIF